MQRVKRRIFSGAVCEQVVFNVPDRIKNLDKAEPRPRFKTEEERAAHKLGISRRKHARIVNNNFGPTSKYSTLTMDDEHEVHTFQEARRVRDNFYNRLIYHAPGAKIMLYMGRGKNTHRIHFHMISEGVPEDLIRKIVREESGGGNGQVVMLLQSLLNTVKAGQVIMVDKAVLGRTARDGINDITTKSGKFTLLF